mgnify:CR=1 FL=1
MKLHWEQNTENSIDILNRGGKRIASVDGPNEGEENITKQERNIAKLICELFNNAPESDGL